MSIAPVPVVENKHMVQFDGTNHTEIATLFNLNESSVTAGVWTFKSPPDADTYNVPTNHYILYTQNMAVAVYPPTGVVAALGTTGAAGAYACNIICDDLPDLSGLEAGVAQLETDMDAAEADIATLQADVSALEAAVGVKAIGVAPVPTLLLSGSATVAVTLQPAMPDSSYTAYASKFAGVSLTDLAITSVTVVDEDTVNVGVSNVGLLTIAGASVMVHAVA